ncbi:MAG: sulfatase-like hydrolase/transferase [Planctomycetota bacterium]
MKTTVSVLEFAFQFAPLFASLLALISAVTGRCAEPLLVQNGKRPNFVIIMADDLGYRDVSCYGCIDFETPNLDNLAASGVRCTSGYVSHPYCSPSRAGLLTGKHQQSFGHEHNPPYDESNREIGIDVGTPLLPGIMAKAGYATGLIGKWHLGAGEPFRPATRGFNEFYGFLGGGHHYFKNKIAGKHYDSPMWRNHAPTEDSLTYLTDDLTAEGERFLERNQARPFCLLMMYNAPHAPDHTTKRYEERVQSIPHKGRRRYAALVQGVDEGVGRLTAKLKELGVMDQTLIVFLSDNGGRAGVSDNRPLRGNKGWLHEGGIRVPFILSMPATLPQGMVYDKPVSALDLMPTAMSLGNIKTPEACYGVDLLPFLKGTSDLSPHETLYWRVCGGGGYAIRDHDWKLVHDIGMEKAELYDLSQDLGEDHNLADTHVRIANRLREKFERWNATLETPRWTENHRDNTTQDRAKARKAGTRQSPMPWIRPTP